MFWLTVRKYKELPSDSDWKSAAEEIYKKYLIETSEKHIVLPKLILESIEEKLIHASWDIFEEAEATIHKIIEEV